MLNNKYTKQPVPKSLHSLYAPRSFIKRWQKLIICSFFIISFILGAVVTFDYGVSPDERTQRNHSIISYHYLYSHITGDSLFESITNLNEYGAKYYGVAMQLPLVAVEHALDFNLSDRTIYLIRHFYTYLVFFASVICTYFLGKILFQSKIFALLASFMIYLYPRLFSIGHFDIKNSIFTSLFTMSIFFMVLFLKYSRRRQYGLMFAFVTALSTNTRIIGVMVLCGSICFMLLEDLSAYFTSKNNVSVAGLDVGYSIKNTIGSYVLLIGSFIIFYIFVTPASWYNPVDYFILTLDTFVGYEPWNGTWAFMGELITKSTMPWYYLPVWISISVPLAYIFFAIVCVIRLFSDILGSGIIGIIKNRYAWIIVGFFLLPLMATMVKKGLIYIGWYHLYFLLPLMVLMATFGIKYTIEALSGLKWFGGKYIAIYITGISLILQAGWIIRNHPYENVYFNIIGRPVASQFIRDDFRMSEYQMLSYLLKVEDGDMNVSFSSRNFRLLPQNGGNRISIVKNKEDSDYIIDNFRYTVGNEYHVDGFEEVHSIWVDDFKICTLLKRK